VELHDAREEKSFLASQATQLQDRLSTAQAELRKSGAARERTEAQLAIVAHSEDFTLACGRTALSGKKSKKNFN
jgi:hypothetical protein